MTNIYEGTPFDMTGTTPSIAYPATVPAGNDLYVMLQDAGNPTLPTGWEIVGTPLGLSPGTLALIKRTAALVGNETGSFSLNFTSNTRKVGYAFCSDGDTFQRTTGVALGAAANAIAADVITPTYANAEVRYVVGAYESNPVAGGTEYTPAASLVLRTAQSQDPGVAIALGGETQATATETTPSPSSHTKANTAVVMAQFTYAFSDSSGGADVTAPVFTEAPAVGTIKKTTAQITATLDELSDTYWVVTQSATKPTFAQIEAGTDELDAAADDSGSVIGATDIDEAISGLTSNTQYYLHIISEDDESTPNRQASATTVAFMTADVFIEHTLQEKTGDATSASLTGVEVIILGGAAGSRSISYQTAAESTDGSKVLNVNDDLIGDVGDTVVFVAITADGRTVAYGSTAVQDANN